MKPEIKEIIYSQLKEAQEKYRGYRGNDIAILEEVSEGLKECKRWLEEKKSKQIWGCQINWGCC
jgi:RNA binding exosome subunit